MQWKHAVVAVATTMVLAPSVAQAQSIGAVENARAKERQGTYLSPQDRENLHRYGGNDGYRAALQLWAVRVWRRVLRRLLWLSAQVSRIPDVPVLMIDDCGCGSTDQRGLP